MRKRCQPQVQTGLSAILFIGCITCVSAQTDFTAFTKTPGVISQIQTVNNEVARIPGAASTPFMTVATATVSRTTVRLALERSESRPGRVVRDEKIGFVAFEANRTGFVTSTNGARVRWATQLTNPVVRGWGNGCTRIRMPNGYAAPPIVVGSMTTRRTTDGGWLRRCSLDANRVGLAIDEDQSLDTERTHIPEQVALFSASRPFDAHINQGSNDAWQLQLGRINMPATRDNSRFRRVRFARVFDAAPVVVVLGDSRSRDPVAVRIRNVTRAGFDVAQVEPSGENGNHPAMGAHFLAVTPGAHRFPDGTALVASTISTRNAQAGRGVAGRRAWSVMRFNTIANTGSSGGSSSGGGTSDTPPRANITTTTLSGAAPLTVGFDSSGSTDDVRIASSTWNFGDGTAGSGPTTSHTYQNPGTYTAVLLVRDSAGQLGRATVSIVVTATPTASISRTDAARFLQQATFGPTEHSIAELERIGIDRWLDRQFALRGPAHLSFVMQAPYSGSHPAGRHEVFWKDVIEGQDQLRQRVAFALSQIFVVSDVGVTLANRQYEMTRYYDHLRNNAFGNYRSLLETVTLSPVMGLFLSMAKNEKADITRNVRPDENYAREVLQLFSIGMHRMRIDGTYPLDANGRRIPAYSQDTVEQFARVFTGWTFAGLTRWDQGFHQGNLMVPMIPFEAYHDRGAKRLLNGATIPAGLSARADLRLALNNIANHPNVGPFFSKQLIQRLVTSNPSPQYVARVARIFNNNGANIRGDLRAVVRAILTDPEARQRQPNSTSYGKLREPVLRLSGLWRAFRVRRGTDSDHGEYNTVSPAPYGFDDIFGQAPLQSPSVFNFFSPGFAPAGPVRSAGLVAPEFQIATESNTLDTTGFLNERIQRFYFGSDANSMRNSHININREIALARNVDALLDHLDTLMMAGSMQTDLRTILRQHLERIPPTGPGLSQRARDAISLIAMSPDYLIQQ